MKICRTIADLHREMGFAPSQSIGFVPTMGYLHEGHLSLVRASRGENDRTVVSIFVNPTQFSPGEDFQRYPRDTERDARMLEREGTDCLFMPESVEMYPAGYSTYVDVEELCRPLCGRIRPTHFRGVATVVLKLFAIVRPDRAYFGQKDAQQAVIIRRMIQDLNLSIRLRVRPIIRDSDGLALSSRNVFLSPDERQAARCMPQALSLAQKKIADGEIDARTIVREIKEALTRETRVEIDYVAAVSLDRLVPLETILAQNTMVACAIRVGRTRLIDNFILGDISC